ncbi:MAG: serine hydrolase [Pseudomonadota bacterium]
MKKNVLIRICFCFAVLFFSVATFAVAATSSLPAPDIKANGQDGPITVTAGTPVSITASLEPGNDSGKLADLWIAASTPGGWYSLNSNGWTLGLNLLAQSPLVNISPVDIYSGALPVGDYAFYFLVDMNPDGIVDSPFYYDFVQVHVVPDPQVPARIMAVENGLLPSYYKSGTTPAGMPITDRMGHYYTPGVSIAVINNNQIEWAKGYGVTIAGTTNAVTADHLFQACSISKPVTAIGVMLLSQAGSIMIDHDVNDYLTSWKVAENDFTAAEKVTIRRLLSHTGGIGVSGFDGYPAGQPIPALLRILNGAPPANNRPVRVEAVPGSAYNYSGGGMEILHQMLEDVTGTTFKDYMNDHLFSKIGMASSSFQQPISGPLSARTVSAHDYMGNVSPGGWKTYPELAAAGLWTTSSDLARIIIEVQQAAMWRGKILSTTTVYQMLASQAAIKANSPEMMGLGFEVKALGSDVEFSHTGSNFGFKTWLVGYRDSGKGAVVMTNSDNGGLLMREIMYGISKVYGWPDIMPEAKELIDVPPGILDSYVGSYGPIGGDIFCEVAMSGVQIAIRFAGTAVLNELYPVAADNFVFFWFGGNGSLTFIRNAAGQVDGLTVVIDGTTTMAPKK